MFSRRKETPEKSPIELLTDLYNEIEDGYLSNLSFEQNGQNNEALAGWRSIHEDFNPRFIQVKYQLENSDIHIGKQERFLLDEISVLQKKSESHYNILSRNEESSHAKQSQQRAQTIQGTRGFGQKSRSSPLVLTLRSDDHQNGQRRQPFTSLRASPKQSATPSLRDSPRKSGTSSLKDPAYSDPAKYAANLIWSPNHSMKSNHSTKMHTKQTTSDPFADFDSSFVANSNPNDEQTNQSSSVTDQMDLLIMDDLPKKPTSDNKTASQYKHHHKRSTSGKQQQQRKAASQRVRSALEKSAAVKLNLPQPVYRVRKRQQASKTSSLGGRSGSSLASLGNKGKTNPTTEKKKEKEVVYSGNDETKDDSEMVEETTEVNGRKINTKKLISSMKGVDPVAARQILDEIVVNGDEVHWSDIAGLEEAKKSLKETVVYPFLRPDLFSGLREPARGMLLFGPPGTGKTMLARAVATESQSTFFSISASSLTSKYLGESEKLVKALFQLAKRLAPSIIFVDEIDSLLGTRDKEGENEASRRIKNEFLVQWSDLTKAAAGRDSGEDVQRVLVLAATNLPWAIDEAARRRFVRRQYIPLPAKNTRKAQFEKLLSQQIHTLSSKDMEELLELTEGFSGSDITALAKDAAMGPLRELGDKLLETRKSEIRPLQLGDFINSLNYIRPSVSRGNLARFEQWAKMYGSSGA